ncbi:sensor histidine kinase (plasmid) [Sphingobium sp. SCG-1]|uniref:MHYT domain-containing protein n=1 Tax=Sphingobium sp. SCG-1 TaxID=2072936 RepID=UPI000CD6B08A|nr:MHYT domain-containing protein [Sphingobium sp. SCG-1]AUW60599.1 sensor histidine kinase [Sphingobium sp. SCG-1]
MTLTGTHDFALVWISILIAIAASYTALDLVGRVRASEDRAKRLWLAAAALAMGGGIWAMHFVAMLAFSMPGMEADYDLGLTLASLLVAIAATGIGFTIMSRHSLPTGPRLIGAGLIMGFGVVAMHYMGMSAMRMAADLRYDRFWVAVSILVAVGAATAALWLASRRSGHVERIIAAIVMGGAISGMHLAGMQAAVFVAKSHVDRASGPTGLGQAAIAVAVSVATFLILATALAAAMFDRRLASMAEREAEFLRQNQERFRRLYKGTPLPLHSTDKAGCLEHVSDAWCALLGYDRGEVIGRPFVHFLTEASAKRFLQEDWPGLLSKGDLSGGEHRAITKLGAILDVVISARVERDPEGNFVQVLAGLTDVTERKRAEEALRQSQKMEAVGHLTGGVAHDFNNLLAIVIGNLDLLRKRLPDDPKAARFLESALEGARRGATLTQRLLSFARKQDLKPEQVDISQLVRGMSDMMQRSLGPMIKIGTRLPLALSAVEVDPHQLELAILNLAVNARDAMPDGGDVEISATEEIVGANEDLAPGSYVRLVVADTGEGMDSETLTRASEPFFTSKGVGKGTGLGLSMVQGFAAQSGGRLTLQSAVGHGTKAEIWLPAAKAATGQAHDREQQPSASLPALESRAILVVDDDPLVLANTVAMLEDLGHRVAPAISGPDAIQQLDHGLEVDLVLTDQMMPQMTGVQLAGALIKRRPSLPVLLVSGYVEFAPDEPHRLPTLQKPFDQRALAEAVEAIFTASNAVSLRGKRR